jgi:hypothetical protein
MRAQDLVEWREAARRPLLTPRWACGQRAPDHGSGRPHPWETTAVKRPAQRVEVDRERLDWLAGEKAAAGRTGASAGAVAALRGSRAPRGTRICPLCSPPLASWSLLAGDDQTSSNQAHRAATGADCPLCGSVTSAVTFWEWSACTMLASMTEIEHVQWDLLNRATESTKVSRIMQSRSRRFRPSCRRPGRTRASKEPW